MDDGISPSRLPSPSHLVRRDPGSSPTSRMTGAAPIVVTATMGAADQRFFDGLRRQYYSRLRHPVPAHITLFHQLPPTACGELQRLIRRIMADAPPPVAWVRGPYSLGDGVAFRIESPALLEIRARMADALHGLLVARDRGVPRLHITIQNKAAPDDARALLTRLMADFRPRQITILGLAAHFYRGGPWEPAFAHNFRVSRTLY